MDGETMPTAELTMPPIAQQIWDMKYRLKSAAGEPVDMTIEDTWRRIATALAEPEPADRRALWADRFYQALQGFKFLPGGRVIAGAGTGREVTLFNCFVMGSIPDNMGGIFAHLREAALTMQQGGGIGYDFSTLRPKGAPVVGVGADASGPLSFIDVWDSMCRTIMSAGCRRGAMMATMRCDHPDIEAFIDAKGEPGRLRMFNLSILVTDAFMDAVETDKPWPLQFGGTVAKVVPARELWDKIMRATYAYAEPGVIFIDRINRRNNLHFCETISATNPCGEQPLPPYGNCLLGSLNLAALVEDPFTPSARIDSERLAWHVETAVRMLDNVIEVSKFPLPEQREEAFAKRRIGLGVTGLADALIMRGLRYGSPEAVAMTSHWLSAIERGAYLASAHLAAEKGAFPLFDRDGYLAGEHVGDLDDEVRVTILHHGMRNSHLISIAPTGTISLLAGNLSGGIEPVFSLEPYTRDLLMPDGTRQQCEIADYAYALWRRLKGDAPLPEYFVDAQSLSPADHLAMLAAAQRHVDSAISKTINLPEAISFEDFQGVYREAYRTGCKSCTTYRPNEVTGAVLTLKSTKPEAEPELALPMPAAGLKATPADVYEAGGITYLTEPLSRPEELPGKTYKLKWPDSDHALYVTVNDFIQDGRRRPFEVFINSKNMEHYAWVVALTRMISAVFRRGGDVAFVAEELQAIFDPRGGAWVAGKYQPSLVAELGAILERHMVAIGFLNPPTPLEQQKLLAVAGAGGQADINFDMPRPRAGLRQCPKCGKAALIRVENCDQCTSCDYSKC